MEYEFVSSTRDAWKIGHYPYGCWML